MPRRAFPSTTLVAARRPRPAPAGVWGRRPPAALTADARPALALHLRRHHPAPATRRRAGPRPPGRPDAEIQALAAAPGAG